MTKGVPLLFLNPFKGDSTEGLFIFGSRSLQKPFKLAAPDFRSQILEAKNKIKLFLSFGRVIAAATKNLDTEPHRVGCIYLAVDPLIFRVKIGIVNCYHSMALVYGLDQK